MPLYMGSNGLIFNMLKNIKETMAIAFFVSSLTNG
jgi:hypothetical protein